MLIGTAIFYCIIYFIYLVASVENSKRIRKKGLFFLALFFGMLILIAFHLVPGKSDDLYRHYALVNWYRAGMPDYADKGKNIMPLEENGLGLMYLFKQSCWLVSKLQSNSFLQIIYLTADFSIAFLWIRSYVDEHKVGRKIVSHYLLLYFSFMPFFMSYSGLRYSTVCHIMGMALYQYYTKKNRIGLLLGYFCAFLIHPATAVFLLIQLWYMLTQNSHYFYYAIVLWRLIVGFAAVLLRNSSIPFIQYTGNKLYYYFYIYGVQADKRRIIAQATFFLLLLVLCKCIKRSEKSKVFKIYEIAMLVGIGSMESQFLDRIANIIGVSILPLIYILYKSIRNKNILTCVLLIYEILLNMYYTITIFTYLSLN